MLPKLVEIITLALAVSAISMTVTKARLFAPTRTCVARKSDWLGELISCPFCFSQWVALVLVAVYRPEIVNSGFDVLDWFVSAMAIVAVAAFFSGLIYKAFSIMEG